jgi:DNA-binding IclR family transcriptional regulator
VTRLSQHRLLSVMHAGDRAPLYATSAGKAILATWPTDEIEAYLSRVSFAAITPSTHRSSASLREELGEVRERGWAISREEYTQGVIGVARPLLTPQWAGQAAVSVAIPVARFSETVQANALRNIANAITALTNASSTAV